MNDKSVRFFHFRKFGNDGKPLPTGGATFAAQLVAEGTVVVAPAMCRDKDRQPGRKNAYSDNFSRRRGRDIALGRLVQRSKIAEYDNLTPGEEMQTVAKVLDTHMARNFGYYRQTKGTTVLTSEVVDATCGCVPPNCC